MIREWSIQEIPWPRDLPATVRAFTRGAPCAWLDSAACENKLSNSESSPHWSMIGREPIGIIEQPERGDARWLVNGRIATTASDGWTIWRDVQNRLPSFRVLDSSIGPGWIGYLGFEMGRFLERLPQTNAYDLSLPLMRLMLFDRAVLLDHQRQSALIVAATGLRASLGLAERRLDEFAEAWRAAADETRAARADDLAVAPCFSTKAEPPRIVFDMPREYYRKMIRRALEYISAGDVYQVNLAQRIRCERVGDAFAAYCRMRRSNPADLAAFLEWPGGALGSVSPELFLRLRGRDVLTSPIKGTRPRTGDPVLDAAYQRELLASEKDAAELAMIIDLHRNDLGKACEFGSVRVLAARRVESHPTVFHTVADVAGRLRPEHDGIDLLKACFPAGSISGVPKIRASEIIDELEPVARGAYTGAIGGLSLDGQMTFNVAIRTVQFHRDAAWVYVGGGIVADSDPEDEYEETLAKAAGMLRGLAGEEAIHMDLEAQAQSGE